MFIFKLFPINKKHPQSLKQAKTQITVKPFVDLFLDTAGWYALGHCDRKQFLATVIKQEKFPYCQFQPQQVQLAWATFEDNNFELVDQSTENAQAITLIENLGDFCEYCEYS